MISQDEVIDIFKSYLPENTTIALWSKYDFIKVALTAPFIQEQIRVGIYNPQNIYTDFLSMACSYVHLNTVVISYPLLRQLCQGIDDDELIRQYVRGVAIHEAHHFMETHSPSNITQIAKAELACNTHLDQTHAEVAEAMKLFETQSLPYQRVYERLRLLDPKERHDGTKQRKS